MFHFQRIVHLCIMGEPIREKTEYDIISKRQHMAENIGIHSTNKIDIFFIQLA